MEKIYILGPINTVNYFGGVATFDEELAKGFDAVGYEVRIFTKQKDIKNIGKVKVYSIRKLKSRIIQDNPKLIIASLEYGLYLRKIKQKNIIKVFFLHGFFSFKNYNFFKAIAGNIAQKLFSQYADCVVSNSYFTRTINEEFAGIKTNFVQHLGISDAFAKELKLKRNTIKKEKNRILFVGRLIEAKGINQLIETAKILKNNNFKYELVIVGDGNKKDNIIENINKFDLPIKLLGKKNQEDLILEYLKSDYFISLNPSEPFGIVFLEAILSKCKIICPYTGGQRESLNRFNDSIIYVDESNSYSIANDIINESKHLKEPSITEKEIDDFTYTNIAKQIIEGINND